MCALYIATNGTVVANIELQIIDEFVPIIVMFLHNSSIEQNRPDTEPYDIT